MGAAPVQIGFGKTETADIKILEVSQVLVKRNHVTREPMRVLEVEAKTSLSVFCDRIVPCIVECGCWFRRVEKGGYPMQQCH
jgi:hypothetical protein